MCGINGKFATEPDHSLLLNQAAICGTVAIGAGYSQLAEFCAALDISNMSNKTYNKIESEFLKESEDLANKEMVEAVEKERALAIEGGEVDTNGIPYIKIILNDA